VTPGQVPTAQTAGNPAGANVAPLTLSPSGPAAAGPVAALTGATVAGFPAWAVVGLAGAVLFALTHKPKRRANHRRRRAQTRLDENRAVT
jgi:hypothetical protein